MCPFFHYFVLHDFLYSLFMISFRALASLSVLPSLSTPILPVRLPSFLPSAASFLLCLSPSVASPFRPREPKKNRKERQRRNDKQINRGRGTKEQDAEASIYAEEEEEEGEESGSPPRETAQAGRIATGRCKEGHSTSD